jgi:hypothetical protein
MATIFELQASSDAGIFAVPYRAGRPRKAFRLPDGAIVEEPLPDQRYDVPENPKGVLGIASAGGPATIHHANLGLIVGYLLLTGLYLLPNGEVAAVYGAEEIPIGVDIETTR